MRRICIVFILLLFSLALTTPSLVEFTSITDSDERIETSQLLNIERTWTANIIIVNYEQSNIDETTLLLTMPTERTYTTDTMFITYTIEYDIFYADETFVNQLSQVVMDNSVNGSDTGTLLNETALLYQKSHLDEPQRIFYPRAGRVIDGYAVEDWLEANPYVPAPSLGYTLYLVNFSSLDTAGHELEHWYDYHAEDPDTGEKQDWFRLEWDNALNSNITMDYAGFGGRYNTFVVDPSAHQWYLQWCRIWWSESIGTEYEFWTNDLEDKMATLDLQNPTDVENLNVYLRETIWDPINLLFFPYQHQPAKYVESGLLRAFVICMDVANGTSVDSLRWVTNADMQKAHLEELYPFIEWDVQVDFIDIDDYPMWNTTFWNYAYVNDNGTTIVDGGPMFDAIHDSIRTQYIDSESNDIQVFGVVFIKKQMEMYYYGKTYTGLGGRGQTVIWKSWERYYRPDGVTPKDGISSIQLHETLHAIGFHHTWQHEHYSSDFSYGPMGYFAYHNGTASYDKNWVQGTYLDQMHTLLWDNFTSIQEGLGTEERPETYIAEQEVIKLFSEANNLYDKMDWDGTFDTLQSASEWLDRLIWSTIDDTAPVITSWHATPNITTTGFGVHAQVSDNLSGVDNVSVIIQIDGDTILRYPCEELYPVLPGTWYASIPALAATDELEVWIESWDWGMNVGQSPPETLVIRTEPTNTTDGTNEGISSLLQYLVIISGIAVIVVVGSVVIWRKRFNRL